MPTPRYLRFARALALCSSLATVPACSGTTGTDTGDEDAPTGTDTPSMADVPSTVDAPIVTDTPSSDDAGLSDDATADVWIDPGLDAGDCSTCDCGFSGIDAGLPSCDSVGLILCCAAVGPLAPPDLPA